MLDQDSKGPSYMAGFFILIAFTVVGLMISSFLSASVWTAMTGRPGSEMEESFKDASYGNVTRIFQIILAVFGFLLPTILTAYLLSRKPMRLIGFTRDVNLKQVGLVVLLLISSVIVASSLQYFTNRIPIPDSWRVTFDNLEKTYNERAIAIIGLKNAGEYLIALVVMAFLPALCEEALFRGGLQNLLTRATRKAWVGIVVASIIFSVIHLSWYLFLPRFFLGVILGLIYYYSGNIWLSVLGHFMNNAFVVSALYIYQVQGKSIKDALMENSGSFWGITLLPVVAGLLILFRKISGPGQLARR